MAIERHYLVKLTYRPRILVYTLTGMTLATLIDGGGIWLPMIIGYSLLYPHLVYHIAGTRLRSRHTVLRLQHLDAFQVGVYCAAVQFSPTPSVAFLTALLLSNLLLAGGRSAAVSIVFLLFGALTCGALIGFRFVYYHGPLTTLLSAISILLYTGLVGHLGFEQIHDLITGRSAMDHSNRRLRGVTDRLRRYIAPQLFSALYANGDELALRTSRKRLVIFFSDIEGFTELTDMMEAEALTDLLNQYLQEMAEIAMRHGGTIDKFMGDGIMIFFGDPYTNGAREDALACVQMALAMRERMRVLRSAWAGEGITRPLHVRIGIHAGFCTVGNFGCDARLDYTVIGGTVNLASRIESAAGRDEILISAEMYSLVQHRFECTLRAGITVKGLARAQDLYLVTGANAGREQAIDHSIPGLTLRVDPATLDPEHGIVLLRQVADQLCLGVGEPGAITSAASAAGRGDGL